MNQIKFKRKRIRKGDAVKRIISAYEAQNRPQSHDWYLQAHDFAESIRGEYPLMIVAGVIAALSPLKSWEDNKRIARLFMLGQRDKLHTGIMIDKAVRILSAKSELEIEEILSGFKISAFFRNIYRPHESGKVTIDRHAISLALGKKLTTNFAMTRIQYDFFSSCYEQAAQDNNIMPHEMQSITWEYQRTL